MYMEKWGELSLSKKEHLISKYGITAVGVPPEPVNAREYHKIPDSEFPVEKKKTVKKVVKKKPAKKVEKKKVEKKKVKKKK